MKFHDSLMQNLIIINKVGGKDHIIDILDRSPNVGSE